MTPAPVHAHHAGERHADTRARHLVYLVAEDWYFLSHRLALARAAQRAGYRITVITNNNGQGERIRREGFALVPLNLARGAINPLHDLHSVLKLALLYRALRPDLVHHVAMKPVIYGSLAARLAKVPARINALAGLGYVFSAKTLRARVLRPLMRLLLSLALPGDRSLLIVQNSDDRAVFARLRLVADARLWLIPGAGVDLGEYRYSPEPPGCPVIILPSRMLRQKGVVEFVEAARILRRRGVDCRCALVGAPDPGNVDSLDESQLRAWHEEGAVEYWGWQPDMGSVLRGAHVVCLPSFREGIPKALIEAAAVGRPIVTSDAPGCREVVVDGDNGLLVPAGDADALAVALERLVRCPEERRRMGQRGRERSRLFRIEEVVRQTLDAYASVAPV